MALGEIPALGGAAGGAIGLQEILQSLAERAFKQQAADEAAKRTAIEQQRVANQSAYRNADLASREAERSANESLRKQQSAKALTDELTPGDVLDQGAGNTLRAGNLGALMQHQGAVLPSTAIQGIAKTTSAAPTLGTVTATENAGHGEQDVYRGTAAQQQQQSQQKALRILAAKDPNSPMAQWINVTGGHGAPPAELFKAPDKPEEVYQTGPNGQLTHAGTVPKGSHIANAPTPPQTPLVMVQTVDENGNPVTKIVPKTAGASFAKPENATTANRVASAETVNKVGNDLIAKLSDPKYAATLGPTLGRFSSLQDFIGNPPPEYSELAGEIESYALANMGVHGMRSAQGAQQISKLLQGRHTPESLAATIRGLNTFSEDFAAAHKPKAGGAGGPAAPAAAAKDPLGIR